MEKLFAVLTFGCIIGSIVSAIALMEYIKKRGKKVSFWLMRFFIFRYVAQYKEITIEESGSPGPWYYRYIGFSIGALFFAIMMILQRSGF